MARTAQQGTPPPPRAPASARATVRGFTRDSAGRYTAGSLMPAGRGTGAPPESRGFGTEALPDASVHEAPAKRFARLASDWLRETGLTSSPSKRFSHPSFLRMLAMDRHVVVPLLLRSVEREPSPLVDALAFFAEDDPVPDEDAGDLRAMSAAWLKWGKDHGFL